MMTREADMPGYTASILLAGALVLGICLAWSPSFPAIFAAQAGILLIAMYWAVAAQKISLSAEWIPVALIAAWGVLQIAAGQTVSPWWTLRGSTTWISATAAFFVASQVTGTRRNREAFLSVVLWSSTALALLAIAQMYVDPGHVFAVFPAQPGSVGTFLYKNQFAAMLELVAPIALYRAFCTRRPRLPHLVAYTVLLAAGVASVSRAGVILLAAELAVAMIVALSLRSLSWRTGLSALALAAVVLAAGAALGGPQRLLDHFQEQEPYQVRRDLLKSTIQMAEARPWTGFGLGTFQIVYPEYANFDLGVFVNAAHCDWAEWAAEGGFPFALIIGALMAMVGARAVQSIWGIGPIAVALHSAVDYPAREPVIAIACLALAGVLTARMERATGPRSGEANNCARLQRRLQPHLQN